MTQERERQPIETIAEEEIARDQERARDWAFVKAKRPWSTYVTTHLPPVQPYATQVTVKPNFLNTLIGMFPFGALGIIAFLAVLFVGGATVLLLSMGPRDPGTAVVVPTPTPTPTAVPDPTPSPEDAPPETPTPTPTLEPTTPPPTDTQVHDDGAGEVITDSGQPIDDAVADIVTVTTTLDDGITAEVRHAAPMGPSDTPGISRSGQFALGRFEEVNGGARAPIAMTGSAAGILAQTGQVQFRPLAVFFWELHDGVVTMGELDPNTGQMVDTTAVPAHVESTGTFTYSIPAAEVPIGTNAVAVVSFHRPREGDERRIDTAGPFALTSEWTGSAWVPVEIVLPSGPVLIDEQGNEIGPAPVDHPARLAQIDYQTDDALAYFCAILPNVEGRAREWQVSFALGDDITGFWRFADGQLTMGAQRADGRDVAGATFPGQVTGVRVCIALPRPTAAGITSFAVETLVQPADGSPAGKHRLEQAVP